MNTLLTLTLSLVGLTYDMGPVVVTETTVVRRQTVASYPVHAQRWNILGNWNPARGVIINHLLTHPNHRGKFDRAYLESLSRAQLLSIHDDDHDQRVQWAYVNRRASSTIIARSTAPTPAALRSVVAKASAVDYLMGAITAPGSKVEYKLERDGDEKVKIAAPGLKVKAKTKRTNGAAYRAFSSACPGGNCPR